MMHSYVAAKLIIAANPTVVLILVVMDDALVPMQVEEYTED